MNRRAVIILTVALLTGCGTVGKVENVGSGLRYVRDERTHLCFAVLHFDGYNTTGLSISSVPCVPEVEALVGK